MVEVLEYLAQYHPEVTLGTGHGSVPEINKLIDKAVELGIRKILVNHPFFHIGASVDDMARWAAQGAFIELNAVVFNVVEPAAHHLELDLIKEIYDRVGYEKLVIDSDMGQAVYRPPCEGLAIFAEAIRQLTGAGDLEMETMMQRNPAWLIGLEERD